MKNMLKVEEAALLGLSVILNQLLLPYAWWWYWALFLAPDLGILGYIVNPRVGAASYNLLHHKGIAVAFFVAGLMLSSFPLQFTGLLMLGHASFDRILGYGLKYSDNFKHTHLGWIGGEVKPADTPV